MPDQDRGFDRCYLVVVALEGGLVTAEQAARIRDGGGATNLGLSLRAIAQLDSDKDGHLDFDFDRDGDVDEIDVRAIGAHPEAARNAYRTEWFEAIGAHRMVWPWNLLAFDASVNHGPAGAATMLQRAVGAPADGKVGEGTLAKIRTASPADQRAFLVERAMLYFLLTLRDLRDEARELARKGAGFAAFEQVIEEYLDRTRKPAKLRGWFRRLFNLQAETFE